MIRAFGYLSDWWRSFASPMPAPPSSSTGRDENELAILGNSVAFSRRGFLGGLGAVSVAAAFHQPLAPTVQTEDLILVFKARPSQFADLARATSSRMYAGEIGIYRGINLYLAPERDQVDFRLQENYRLRHA